MWMNISVSGHKGLSDGETTLYSSSLGTPALSVLGELTLGHLRYLSFPPKRQSFPPKNALSREVHAAKTIMFTVAILAQGKHSG